MLAARNQTHQKDTTQADRDSGKTGVAVVFNDAILIGYQCTAQRGGGAHADLLHGGVDAHETGANPRRYRRCDQRHRRNDTTIRGYKK